MFKCLIVLLCHKAPRCKTEQLHSYQLCHDSIYFCLCNGSRVMELGWGTCGFRWWIIPTIYSHFSSSMFIVPLRYLLTGEYFSHGCSEIVWVKLWGSELHWKMEYFLRLVYLASLHYMMRKYSLVYCIAIKTICLHCYCTWLKEILRTAILLLFLLFI